MRRSVVVLVAMAFEVMGALVAAIHQSPGLPGPGFGLRAGRRLVPLSHPRLYSGLSLGLIDSDVLQDKPCGVSSQHLATGSQSLQIWRLQSQLEPSYRCKCKASDAYDLRQIDYSHLARLDCLTEISGHYCCLRT